MPRKLKILAITGLLGAAVACDRTPIEPAFADIESLLAAAAPSIAEFGNTGTLTALFREAIAAVEKAEGRRGVESLLGNWRALQEDLTAHASTASRSAVEVQLAAIHAEQLRVVRRALGNAVITRVVSETDRGLEEARRHIELAEMAGADVTAARSTALQVQDGLAAANAAVAERALDGALDRATRSAALLGGLRYHLVELRRVPGLESLYPRALEKLKQQKGDVAAAALLAKLETLEAQARVAVRSGDRARAHTSLAQVRAEQIRTVQRVLGNGEAVRLVKQVRARASEARGALDSLRAAGRDVAQHERMLKQVLDLNQHAAASLANGDHGSALDFGSHAAGLLNALQHLTWH
jgi:hypothetical protein